MDMALERMDHFGGLFEQESVARLRAAFRTRPQGGGAVLLHRRAMASTPAIVVAP